MKRMNKLFCLLAVTGIAASAAQAHHSTRGIYEEEEIELHGTVKEWRFINPHPYLTVEAEGPDGQMHEYDVSYGGAAVVHLKRQGYTADTFKPGDEIVLHGNPAKAEGVYGVLIEGGRHPTRPDGTRFVEGGSMF